MENITLIGMPGSGKTTLGRALARRRGMTFLDSDREIERLHGGTLAQIIARVGQSGFRAIEEEVNAGLQVCHTVIATGGSVIYGPRAMEHLHAISCVVYLRLSLDTLTRRLGDLTARGVTFAPGQTLADLYAERCPLYEQYAHLALDCERLTLPQSVDRLDALLGSAPSRR